VKIRTELAVSLQEKGDGRAFLLRRSMWEAGVVELPRGSSGQRGSSARGRRCEAAGGGERDGAPSDAIANCLIDDAGGN